MADSLPEGEVLLEARGLSQSYGYRRILNDLDLTLHRGEIAVLRGANGSGKTTLMKVLCGLLRPRSGTIRLRDPKADFSLFTPDCYLYDDLTVRENLSFYQRLYQADGARLERAEQDFLLESLLDTPVRQLSLGQKMRTALARTFLMPATFYFLDEPFGALDQISYDHLVKVIARLRGEGAHVLISNHLIERGSELFDRVLYLEGGKLRQ
ncbi:MAG TPA: ABC transporter ATP-binding protein [bacterium]|nr:ABC transporter ATP-binding protein [bacterium]